MNLDETLAAWADSVRLPDDAAADIYREIVTTRTRIHPVATGLDAKWWRSFTADFSETMINSTRPAAWAA